MKKFLTITLVFAAAGMLYAEMAPVDGTNTVGFSSVAHTGHDNTILTVPYVACMDNDGDITLADLVSTNGLVAAGDAGSADQLIVMVEDNGLKYYYYWLQTGAGWTAITTSVKHPDGSEDPVSPPAADALDVARGKGFWLKRVATSSSDVFVKGEVSVSNPSTGVANGLNLIGYGSAAAMDLNDGGINWTGADGGNGNTATSDKIIVVESDGSLSYYYYFVDPGWGGAYAALSGKWIKSDYTVADVTIPAGQGFWYLRRDGGTFNFQPDN